jgi:hypothetical protein
MKPTRCPERVDPRAISQVKAIARVTGKGINVRICVSVDGCVVYEDRVWNGVIESSLAWTLESEDEAAAFAEQRAAWLEREVVPIVGGTVAATPFVFTWPTP